MPHRLILKVTKFQLPPPKRLSTVVKNILGGHHAPPPMSNRVKLVNFVPESIVPNIVECFFDIQEGYYYMFPPIEAFHNGLRETKGGCLLTWIS